MATPTEYSIIFRYTGKNNTGCGSGGGLKTEVLRSAFTIKNGQNGGNIGMNIGKVNRIVYRHYHTSTATTPTWNLYGDIVRGDGVHVVQSPSVSYRFPYPRVEDAHLYTNVIDGSNFPANEVYTWSRVRTYAVSGSGDAVLYWRATSSAPMEVEFFFYRKEDMVDGSDEPTITGVTYGDQYVLPNSLGSPYSYFSNKYVNKFSKPTLTFGYTTDSDDYEYLTSNHNLKISYGQTVLYDNTVEGSLSVGTVTFNIGTLNISGLSSPSNISAVYTITDNADHNVSQSYTLAVIPYSSPSVSVPSALRYEEQISPYGDTYYEESDDGEIVQFEASASVDTLGSYASSTNKNVYGLIIKYGSEETIDTSPQTKVIYSSLSTSEDTSYSVEQSTTDISSQPLADVEISSSDTYVFRFIATDLFSSTTVEVSVDEAGALFDIEEDGVAVGMRSTGDSTHKKFEVAEDYQTHFYGESAFHGISYHHGNYIGMFATGAAARTPTESRVWTYTIPKDGNYIAIIHVEWSDNSTGFRYIHFVHSQEGSLGQKIRYPAVGISENQLIGVAPNAKAGETIGVNLAFSGASSLWALADIWLFVL